MKKYFLLTACALLSIFCHSQFKINGGIHLVNSGSVNIVIDKMDFLIDGTLVPSNSRVKFTGNVNTVLGGLNNSDFYEMEIAKSANNKLILSKNVLINKKVIFNSGLIDLNQRNIELSPDAFLENESSSSRITGPSGGEVLINVIMNSPLAVNAGNLGAIITSAANPGAVTIKRGHKIQTGTGLNSSIERYYDIAPAVNNGLNATLRFSYFDAEMNGYNESSLSLYRSVNGGNTWTNEGFTMRDIAQNFVEKSGINSFSKWTLSAPGTELTPIISAGQTGLNFPSAESSKDFVLSVVNLMNIETSGQVIVRLVKLSSFSYTVPLINGITNGIPVQNEDWIVDYNNPAFVTFILKPGVFIPGSAASSIGISVTRNQGVGANTTQSMTLVIQNGTGGDLDPTNNTVTTAITAN